jgi:hypothetical protein
MVDHGEYAANERKRGVLVIVRLLTEDYLAAVVVCIQEVNTTGLLLAGAMKIHNKWLGKKQ